jgi:hypothetical protein
METVTRDPWLDMTTVEHGYFHRQDFHLLDKRARLAALPLDSCRPGRRYLLSETAIAAAHAVHLQDRHRWEQRYEFSNAGLFPKP